jgi:hypothetical protein
LKKLLSKRLNGVIYFSLAFCLKRERERERERENRIEGFLKQQKSELGQIVSTKKRIGK